MPIRLYLRADLHPRADLREDAQIAVSASQSHYLLRTMRRGVGDPVVLFNGRDGEWQSRIEAATRDAVILRVGERLRPQLGEPDLWLALALLKREATELVVQKATELGVSAILLVAAERSVARRANLDRLAAIAGEAAEQCERLSVPVLHAPASLAALLAAWPDARPLAAAIERSAPPILQRTPILQAAGGLLVGPEGGFARAELDALARAPFVSAVSLGPRILRAETAAIAGLARLTSFCPQ